MDKIIPSAGELDPLQTPTESGFARIVPIGGIRADQIEREKTLVEDYGIRNREVVGNVVYDGRLNADPTNTFQGPAGVLIKSDGNNLAVLPTARTREHFSKSNSQAQPIGRKALKSLKDTATYLLSDDFSPRGGEPKPSKSRRKLPLGIFRPL